ncbi:Nucleolar protein 13 [Emydomyces testavorans]|uniref:Nucleolar protein 13 n=1 Tax=Emydomyces testavorans TaxID=2070801 RepID=A0AAF0IKF2_9EURO|nr:Nucleolar protein 13 [Emydomyces testavorans]
MLEAPNPSPKANRKRKLSPEITVDLSAPEPPSKKALRKAKKTPAATKSADAQATDTKPEARETAQKTINQRSGFGIWIGNLPFSATQDDLRKFLTTQGSFINPDEITRIHLPSGERRNGRQQNKGFAYIDFSTSAAVQRAIALSEQLLAGRAVLIKDANNFAGRPEKTREGSEIPTKSKISGNPASRKIFVGNLAFDTTKEILEEHYQPCGGISHVHIATFEDSGKCKGYGWVEFEELESAEAAVRGFVKVPEDEDMENAGMSGSDEEPRRLQKKQKKLKEKKLWVNRLLGRNLRMEFAEDSTTRYKKRFGKESSGKQGTSPMDEGGGRDPDADPIEEIPFERTSLPGSKHKGAELKQKAKAKGYFNDRYSTETVQKLSGTIVESQGKRIAFD